MKITVKNLSGAGSEIDSSIEAVEGDKGLQVVHDAVVAYNAAQRSGTACAKTRGEVAGSNKKPWRQKGTGRARAGEVRSPIWRGGGVTFGPRPRDFDKSMNKKARKLAFQKALTERIGDSELAVTEDLTLSAPKTKELIAALAKLGVDGTVLIVTAELDENIALAARNIPHVEIRVADTLNTYDVLRPDQIVITKEALSILEERLKKN